jgi:mannan polymerase II complex ANP1 subunit
LTTLWTLLQPFLSFLNFFVTQYPIVCFSYIIGISAEIPPGISTVLPSRESCLKPGAMGTPLTGTVIITGGNGLLGSEIAIEIAKKQPFVHLLLTARDIRTDDVRDLIGKIRLIGPRSIEVLTLDLTDLKSVASFAKSTVDRVRFKDIPPVTSLIHSAVATSYVVDDLTSDGYDPVYQTNCLSPFLLTIGLLEAFRAGDGTPKGGAKVINIGCSAATSCGRLDYFDRDHGRHDRQPGTSLSAKEGNIRFGSSKLIASVALYALRRSLIWVSCNLQPPMFLTCY